MPETARHAALKMADHVIERHLAAAFEQLDAGTPGVAARKFLYVRLVERSLIMARDRLPDPLLWKQLATHLQESMMQQA